ncbi:MAG: autotransporter outer membrane beta-barrel domain-containing protein, partial [Caulobacteraceae bacterium]
DCLSLTGGSTAGSTQILVRDTGASPFGGFNPTGIVLVDVTGAGSTAASHFSIDPTSAGWRTDPASADGVIDKGMFFYDLTLDGKQHKLVGLPDGEAFEFTTFGAALSSIWQTTTGTWFERQADLRTQLPALDDSGAGVWMKITGAAAERDRTQGYDLFGVSYEFDTSYEQNTMALIGGLDFMGGGSGKAWVIGGQIGYVDSDVTYDKSPTLTSFEGMTFGLYGTYISGPWFVDAIVNANSLDYEHQAVTLAPAGSNVFTGSVDSLGFQVEGGWSMPIGANGFFEPLASVS